MAELGRVDVVIGNAGINDDALLAHHPTEVFERVIANNLTSAFLLSRRAVQEFIDQESGGHIVFVGSVSARGATSQTAYAASKAGLTGLARTISKEYGSRGVHANVVCPGLVDTDLAREIQPRHTQRMLELIPQRRGGKPEEVARAILHLASSTYTLGEELYVSGGLGEIPL